jgi:F-type H+-transporting ATPase subunit delta
MPSLTRNYALGLLAAARTPEEAETIEKTLSDFIRALNETGGLALFLGNPAAPASAKKDAITALLTDAPDYARNFLCLLIDKGRFSLLRDIAAEYRQERAKLTGDLYLKVYSSVPLDESTLHDISERYCAKYGASSATVENEVDSSLIGGLRVQIGDVLVDHSVSGRLRGLTAALHAKAD